MLVDAYPKLGASTTEDVWDWSLEVERAVLEVLGSDSGAYDIVREVKQLRLVVDASPRRIRRRDHLMMDVFGPIRARTYAALMAASTEGQEEPMVVRVVDLHPWVAEAAEPLFDDGHRRQAIIAAAQNLEKRWKELLGVATNPACPGLRKSRSRRAHPRQLIPGCDSRLSAPTPTRRHGRTLIWARWSTPKAARCVFAT